MNQNERLRKLLIIGTGASRAFKHADSRKTTYLGPFSNGILIGDIPVLFETVATYSIQTVTYCNIGIVHSKDVKDFLFKNPQLRNSMMEEILWNPHDHLR